MKAAEFTKFPGIMQESQKETVRGNGEDTLDDQRHNIAFKEYLRGRPVDE